MEFLANMAFKLIATLKKVLSWELFVLFSWMCPAGGDGSQLILYQNMETGLLLHLFLLARLLPTIIDPVVQTWNAVEVNSKNHSG